MLTAQAAQGRAWERAREGERARESDRTRESDDIHQLVDDMQVLPTQFTCFTGTKSTTLTQKEVRAAREGRSACSEAARAHCAGI